MHSIKCRLHLRFERLHGLITLLEGQLFRFKAIIQGLLIELDHKLLNWTYSIKRYLHRNKISMQWDLKVWELSMQVWPLNFFNLNNYKSKCNKNKLRTYKSKINHLMNVQVIRDQVSKKAKAQLKFQQIIIKQSEESNLLQAQRRKSQLPKQGIKSKK